jgi:N-methylhydantoinase A
LIPRAPGNLSAFGLIVSDVRHDEVMHWMTLLTEAGNEMLEKKFQKMEENAVAILLSEGFDTAKIKLKRGLDLRYQGQAFELTTPVQSGDSVDTIEKRFARQFFHRYGHSHAGQAVELVNLRLTSLGVIDKPFVSEIESQGNTLRQAKTDETAVFFDGRFWDTSVFERALLAPREYLQGPAIVEEKGATIVIPPGWAAEVDDGGNIILNRRSL